MKKIEWHSPLVTKEEWERWQKPFDPSKLDDAALRRQLDLHELVGKIMEPRLAAPIDGDGVAGQ